MKTGFFKSVLGLGITLAAFLVTSCDQPVALGQKVDLTAPVLVIVQDGGSLAPGAYIQGADNNIRVSAKDDSGIESVTVTYTYRYVLTQEDVAAGGPYEGQAAGEIIDKTKTVNARDYGNDIYGLDINSTDPDDPMADGEVNVRITAKDGSGKEGVLSNQTYTVKNDPPAIELNIPKLALSGESR
ncbi:MAG: hypothetical protein LBL28_08880, partial [Treponema sp.]|nr:hypothetical protein [Treponema sp.]